MDQSDESEFREIYDFGIQYSPPQGWGSKELSEVTSRVTADYGSSGTFSGTPDDLRAALFFLLRAWRFEGRFMPSDDPEMPLFRDLVEAIKRL